MVIMSHFLTISSCIHDQTGWLQITVIDDGVPLFKNAKFKVRVSQIVLASEYIKEHHMNDDGTARLIRPHAAHNSQGSSIDQAGSLDGHDTTQSTGLSDTTLVKSDLVKPSLIQLRKKSSDRSQQQGTIDCEEVNGREEVNERKISQVQPSGIMGLHEEFTHKANRFNNIRLFSLFLDVMGA